MKVYVVTEGEYSSYHIEQVFSTKEQAEKYIAAHSVQYDYYDIEEYEVDSAMIDCKKVYYGVSYHITRYGDICINTPAFVYSKNPISFNIFNNYGICPIPTSTLSEEQMKKIVSDKYAEYKAQREGIV